MKQLILSSLVIAVLAFTGCSNDDSPSSPDPTPSPNPSGNIYNDDGSWKAETLEGFMNKTTVNADATGADESAFSWTVAKGGTTLDTDTSNATELSEDIDSDMTLEDNKYEIKGAVFVREGATLTIPAGTRFYANPTNDNENDNSSADVLYIEQGAKLMAEGTADNPIVFTSTTEESGSWGGIVILGKAPINLDGGTGISEVSDNAGEDLVYGGDQPDDNSGVLQYVILAYPGTQINTESEFNGFSFYSVGNGTTLENLECYQGQDDAYEWFGGTVEATNLYGNAYDDTFDWTDGWTGGITNMVAKQPSGADNCIEADNLKADPNAEPRSFPTLTNVTLMSDGSTQSGVLFRRGTGVVLNNAKFVINNSTSIPNINIDNPETAEFVLNGGTEFNDVNFDDDNPNFGGNANL